MILTECPDNEEEWLPAVPARADFHLPKAGTLRAVFGETVPETFRWKKVYSWFEVFDLEIFDQFVASPNCGNGENDYPGNTEYTTE